MVDGATDAAVAGPPLPWPHAALAVPERSDDAVGELGRLLFYDPVLSSDGAVACATCHSEVWGMSDGLPVSVGVEGEGATGPGRRGPNLTRRNAQTLWNVAYRERLFWDGRATTLEEQVHFPLEAPAEMNLPPARAVAAVAAVADYGPLFEAAFGDATVTEDRLNRALAAFERTLVSRRAPYDQYVAGDADAISPTTAAGMFAFERVGCADCHTPPRFEVERYDDRQIGRESDDLGRHEVTGRDADRRTFRVPTLRNVRETQPYFHDGSVEELVDAVRHETALQVARGTIDVVSEQDVLAITEFLDKALTDSSAEPSRPRTVPSGLEVPADGFRFPR